MTSILISSDVLELGETVAKRVAEALNATLVGRNILDEIAEQCRVQKSELISVLGFSGRYGAAEKKLLMYLEKSTIERLKEDNIVCTGLGAHLYIRGVSHILNIRVLSDMASLTHRMAAEKNISPRKVRRILEGRMRKRREWTLSAFDIDETQPANYDMLFTLGNLDVERIVQTIVETTVDKRFAAMTYSRNCLKNQALAAKVRLALVEKYADVKVKAWRGTVYVYLLKGWGWRRKAEAVKQIVTNVEGVNQVHVRLASQEDETSDAKEAGAA